MLFFYTKTSAQTYNFIETNRESDLTWISVGMGCSSNDRYGFDVNACYLTKNHCFSFQYAHLEEIKFNIFGYEPADNRAEFNLSYGRNATSGNVIAMCSSGLCYVNENIYEIVGSYNTDPDNWFFGTEYIWGLRKRSYFGINLNGQIIFRSRNIGIGPSFSFNLAKEKTFMSAYVNLSIGKLK
jgi:hypothetical protein